MKKEAKSRSSAWPPSGGEMADRIREHDWAATPLGPIEAWSPSLRMATDLILAMPGPATLLWGASSVQLYNDAYIAIAQDRHPALLGRSVAEGWPDADEAVIAPLLEASRAGRSTRLARFAVALRGPDRRIEERAFDTDWVPIRDESGAVAGALQTLTEVTERHRAEAALRESETRYRAFVTASSDVVYRMSPDWSQMRALTGQGFLADTSEPSGTWMERYIHPDDQPTVRAAIDGAIRTRSPFELEHRVRQADGSLGWTLSRAVPILDESGAITEWLGAARDVTARKRAEAALATSEEKQAFLLKLSDALRPIGDPVAMQEAAVALLGRHLGVDRALYAQFQREGESEFVLVGREHLSPGMPSFKGRHSAEQFGPDLDLLRAGKTVAVADVETQPASEAEKGVWRAAETRARLWVPLVKDGRLVAGIGVHSRAPRAWTEAEIALIAETGERTWAAVERARAEAAQRASEAQYRTLFDMMTAGFALCECVRAPADGAGAPGRVVDVRWLALNAALTAQTGLSREVEGRTALEVFGQVDDLWLRVCQDVVDTGTPTRFEEEQRALGRWYDVSLFPQGGDRLACLYDDITARKRAEVALRESETRHRLLIESWAQAVWETDAAGIVVEDSPSWRSYTGQTLEEWLGYGWLDAIHPDDRAYAERQWREAVSAREQVDAEFRLRAPNGGWRWTNVRAAPVIDAGGNIGKWLGLNIDIDDRKQAEAGRRESEERYRALFESMDEAYAVVEVLKNNDGRWTDFRFLQVNRAFLEHTTMPWPVGKTATELLGSPNPRWVELYGEALDTGLPLRVEEPEATLGLIFSLNIFALDRERDRVAVLFTNITERKRAETALRESEERQAFLLQLSDALRPLGDAEAIQRVSARLVGEHFGVANANYARVELEGGATFYDVRGSYAAHGRHSVDGRHRRTGFPGVTDGLHAGRALVVPEVAAEPALSPEDKASYAAMDVAAVAMVPLVKDGRLTAILGAHDPRPRAWSPAEIALLGEVAERTWAAVERARAEAALRASEERQAFLLAMGDRMRAQDSPDATVAVASRMLGEKLRASRVVFAEIDEPADLVHLHEGWLADGVRSLGATIRLSDFRGPLFEQMRTGQAVCYDVGEPPYASPDLASLAAIGVKSALSVPLVVGGRVVFSFNIQEDRPRVWTDDERALTQEVAERTWAAFERARAEAALRASEERYRSLFETMGQGYCELQLVRDGSGRAIDHRYLELNPAFERLAGIPASEARGRTANEVFPDLEPSWHETYDGIAKKGMPQRIEHQLGSLDRWFEINCYPRGGDRLTLLFEDITARKRAEAALRESEERQAFLLKLSDALRPISDSQAMQAIAARLLGEALDAERCYYVEFDWPADVLHVRQEYVAGTSFSVLGAHPISAFDAMLRHTHGGEPIVCDAIDAHPLFGSEAAAFRERGTDAFILMPLAKEGRMAACIGVDMSVPRHWSAAEVQRVREVAERTWDAVERARAEAALRESEERQAFLLRLSDALRPLTDPVAIRGAACRLAGEHLRADRTYYGNIDVAREMFLVERDYVRGDAPSLAGEYTFAEFGLPLDILRAGDPIVVEDVATSPSIRDANRAGFEAIALRSFLVVPLNKNGELAVGLAATSTTPRTWTAEEASLLMAVAERTWKAVERARAEAALWESDERQAFLLKLSDALRPLNDPLQIQSVAARTLGEHLGVSRALYGEDDGEYFQVWRDFCQEGVASLVGPYRFADFGEYVSAAHRAGLLLAVDDVDAKPELSDEERAAYRAIHVRAFVSVTLIKGSKNVVVFGLHQSEPRVWTDAELALTQDVAERTWAAVERARAEAALRESDERQAFLLKLSDALRPLNDAREIQATATRIVGEHLGVDRAAYVEIEPDGDDRVGVFRAQFLKEVPPFPERVSVAEFGSGFVGEDFDRNLPVAICDARTDQRLDEATRTKWVATSLISGLAIPLVKQGRVQICFAVHQATPRSWTQAEIELMTEVAERTWAAAERARAEAALRTSEERLREFGEASQDVLWIRDAETLQWSYLTPAFETIYGVGRDEALSGDNYRSWLKLIVPEDREHATDMMRRIRAGEHVTFEYRIRRPADGAIRWLRNTDFPIRDEHGRVALIGGIGHDATELRDAELRLRTLLEGIPQLVWRAVDGGKWTWASPQWTAFTGQAEGDSHGLGWLDCLHPDDRELAMTTWSHAIETGGFNVEYRLRRRAGECRWFSTRATPVRDEAGAIVEWLGTSTDIDDLRRLQDEQKVMVAELQHRTRNLIAVVRSIAGQTMAQTGPTEAFRAQFNDRLAALSRVQGLLSRASEAPITIGQLIRMELDALGAKEVADRIELGGPEVRLRNSVVQTLALALHELATNARKYGALATGDGALKVTWNVRRADGAGRQLALEWLEQGIERGREEQSPVRKGYGRELIERALPYALSAKTSYEIDDQRVRCTIDLPLDTSNGSRERV